MLSGLTFALLSLPLAVFLRDKSQRGHLLGVPGFEHYFPQLPAGPWWKDVFYLLSYWSKSLYIVTEANFEFATNSELARACIVLLFTLTLLGAVSLVLSMKDDPTKRALAIFIGGVAITWVALNAGVRFPLGPTRHILVLGPILALLVAEGVTFIAARGRRLSTMAQVATWSLLGTMALLFLRGYPHYKAQREDPFEEAAIGQLVVQYHLDTIVGYGATWNPALMFRRSNTKVEFLDLDAIVRKGAASKRTLP